MHIAILGPFGDLNLGEEATFVATLHNVAKRCPGAQVSCGCFSFEEASRRYGIETFPLQRMSRAKARSRHRRVEAAAASRNTASQAPTPQAATPQAATPQAATDSTPPPKQRRPRSLARMALRPFAAVWALLLNCVGEAFFSADCFRRLRGVDLLVVAGANQCFDFFGGPWRYPFLLLRWAVLAKLRGTRFVFLSVGAGPIRSRLSRLFLKWALSLADDLSFRDPTSRDEAIHLGIDKGRCVVLPDLAFGLPAPDGGASRVGKPRPVVAINPMPVFDDRYWPDKAKDLYRGYVEKLAAFADWLLERNYPVFFFATQPKDEFVIRDIGALMTKKDGLRLDGNYPISVEKVLARISEADIVLATRFHGIILSYVANRPVLGIAYWNKTKDVMESLGQSAYLANPTGLLGTGGDFSLADLLERFHLLESRLEDEKVRLAAAVKSLRGELDAAFDRLLGVSGAHSSAPAKSVRSGA